MRTTAKTANGDAVTAHELALYAVNEEVLYRRQAQPIIKRLAYFKRKGTYDSAKALTVWGYLVESAAKAYVQEFCDRSTKWYEMFPPCVRHLAAEEVAEHYADEVDNAQNPA